MGRWISAVCQGPFNPVWFTRCKYTGATNPYFFIVANIASAWHVWLYDIFFESFFKVFGRRERWVTFSNFIFMSLLSFCSPPQRTASCLAWWDTSSLSSPPRSIFSYWRWKTWFVLLLCHHLEGRWWQNFIFQRSRLGDMFINRFPIVTFIHALVKVLRRTTSQKWPNIHHMLWVKQKKGCFMYVETFT